jgi:hypothetical protein
LSAAASCTLPSTEDPRSAEQAADEYALDNSARAQTAGLNITQIKGCDTDASGYVTVQYGANQHLFFAPVLGAGSDRLVTTAATAIWGPAGMANPLPLVVYQNAFNSCRLDTDPVPGTMCAIWEDNSNTDGSQSGFGFLDLRTDNPARHGWDSVPGAQCDNPGNDIKDWIDNYPSPDVGDLPVNYPNPTYVCLATGGKQVAFGNDPQDNGPLYDLIDDDDVADNNDDEDVLFLPLNRCSPTLPGGTFGQIDSSGGQVACPTTPHQYDIIGFAAVKLEAIYTPNEANGASGKCSEKRAMPGVNNGVFDLVTFGMFVGCFASPPDTISNVGIKNATLNTDYTVDYSNPANPIVTWLKPPPDKDYTVEFNWATAGPCGIPPPNNSGHCLLVQVMERRLGGILGTGGTPDSNLDAVKLCDPIITTSCDPVPVP